MERRIFGIENEYGITASSEGQRTLTPDEVARQLIGLGLAWNLWGPGTEPLSVGLAVVALVVLLGLVHPATTAVLEEDSYA